MVNLHMIIPIGNVAFTPSFPVDVLMKSDPAIIHTREAL